MGKYYSTTQIAGIIGVTPETVKRWEGEKLIPTAARFGRQKKRIWYESQLQQILEFARDNGYSVKEWLI